MLFRSENLDAYAGTSDVTPTVRKEVNRIKHDAGVMIREDRHVSLDDAIKAFRDLVDAIDYVT